MKIKTIFASTVIGAAVLVAGVVFGSLSVNAQSASTSIEIKTTSPKIITTTTSTTSSNNNVMINTSLGGEANTTSIVTTSAAVAGVSVDLDAYATSLSSADASVTAVNTSSDNAVSVTYKRPAKLFGFIPVSIMETATVKADENGAASASVRKSWWSVFASTDAKTDQFSADLKSRVQGSTSASANAALTTSEKAVYLADINAAAQATYGASQ